MNATDGSGPVDRDVGRIIQALIRETDDQGSVRIQLGEVHAIRDELDRLRAEMEALQAEAKLMRAAMTMSMKILGPLGEAVKAELAKQPTPNAQVSGAGTASA
jgi:hypothetical protein